MIEVIYREDVSEDSIHEPRNVKQVGSVDPKYRIYLEDTVLTCIRKRTAEENEVHFGVLLGELKRAAGTTYIFIRGMVKAARKGKEVEAELPQDTKDAECGTGGETEEAGERREKKSEEKKEPCRSGSGAVALERLTLDRQRGKTGEGGDHAPACAPEPLIELDGETWTQLYEEINHYFPDMEILGWYASLPFLNVVEFDLCRQVHFTHFSGADKVLFLCDRTEREENFYRPDGPELRETEGYFIFREKNDAMLTYQQEREPGNGDKEAPQAEEQKKGSVRQGTLGEAPRRKWNISAASVFVTALLLAAVLVVNQYNSRLKTKGTASADETAGEGTTSVLAVAVDGTVSDSNNPVDGTGDGNADSAGSDGTENDGDDPGEGTEEGTADGQDTEEGNAGGQGTEEGTAVDQETEDGSADGQDTEDETTVRQSTESETAGSRETEENKDSQEAEDGNASDKDPSEAGTGNENTENGGGNASEEETVQTGSRVSARYYTVKNGETLYSICMDVYKTSAMVEIVRVLNGIGEDYVIQEGQKILLP